MRGVFGRFFRNLIEGDPVAIGCAVGLVVMVSVVLLIWSKIARDLRREDEEQKKRYGGGKKKS